MESKKNLLAILLPAVYGVVSFLFALTAESKNIEIIDVTNSQILRDLNADILKKAKHPFVCELLNNFVRDRLMNGETLSASELNNFSHGDHDFNRLYKCYEKFGVSEENDKLYFWEIFPQVKYKRKLYFIFLNGNTHVKSWIKSWTTYDKKTFIIVDSHTSTEDLQRSLIHEYAISQDVKYDATIYGMYIFKEENLYFDPLAKEFYKAWYNYPLIRVGLSVIRSKNMEELVFKGKIGNTSSCYANMYNNLKSLAPYQNKFIESNDESSSTSFLVASKLDAHAIEQWGIKKSYKYMSDDELSSSINNLKKLDQKELLCKFLSDPAMGSTSNYLPTGPRPRIGPGVTGEALLENDIKNNMDYPIRDENNKFSENIKLRIETSNDSTQKADAERILGNQSQTYNDALETLTRILKNE